MRKKEFLRAVDACLDGTANSWQRFIVDDYYDSSNHELEILELYRDSEIKEIYERILSNIHKRIQHLG